MLQFYCKPVVVERRVVGIVGYSVAAENESVGRFGVEQRGVECVECVVLDHDAGIALASVEISFLILKPMDLGVD